MRGDNNWGENLNRIIGYTTVFDVYMFKSKLTDNLSNIH